MVTIIRKLSFRLDGTKLSPGLAGFSNRNLHHFPWGQPVTVGQQNGRHFHWKMMLPYCCVENSNARIASFGEDGHCGACGYHADRGVSIHRRVLRLSHQRCEAFADLCALTTPYPPSPRVMSGYAWNSWTVAWTRYRTRSTTSCTRQFLSPSWE